MWVLHCIMAQRCRIKIPSGSYTASWPYDVGHQYGMVILIYLLMTLQGAGSGYSTRLRFTDDPLIEDLVTDGCPWPGQGGWGCWCWCWCWCWWGWGWGSSELDLNSLGHYLKDNTNSWLIEEIFHHYPSFFGRTKLNWNGERQTGHINANLPIQIQNSSSVKELEVSLFSTSK